MKTRRQFLFHCSTLTLAAGLLPEALVSAGARPAPALPPGFAAFSGQLGTLFTVATPGAGAIRVKLIEAKWQVSQHPLAAQAADAQHEKFSLLFQGSGPAGLPQDTYTFAHPALGQLPIFIVPVRVRGTETPHYEAIFNRPSAISLT